MSNPYPTLGVNRNATDEEIHQAYLARIRECPPERDAERFQAVRRAYELIKTRQTRLQFELFNCDPPTVDELLEAALQATKPQRATEEQIRQSMKATAAAFAAAFASRKEPT